MQRRKGMGLGVLPALTSLLGSLVGCSNAGTVLETTKENGNQDDSGARVMMSGSTSQGGAGPVHTGGVAGGATEGGSAGVLMDGVGGGASAVDAGNYCAGQAIAAETLPVGLYLMLDQSSSMGDPLPSGSGTWWSAIQGAVGALVNSPSMVGTSVGIQYFPLGGVAPASCTADYATPEIELGPLPGNADAITHSVLGHAPTAFTPTAPALQGALNHMKDWASKHPGEQPAVVFVTDGFPTECEPEQIPDVAAIAGAAFSATPPVRTFVIGINLGQAGANLDAIAAAGGTGKAILIDSGSVQAQFVTAMTTIAASAGAAPVLCSLQTPAVATGSEIDYAKVSVRLNEGASAQVLTRLSSLGQCQSGDGWYFADNTSMPRVIDLCPHTCAAVQIGGRVQIQYGCVSP